jgi:hypothetical protein
MNRKEAVQYLHDRHPGVIDAPDADVDLEALHLEVFWLQGHTCDLMDKRAARVSECFATIHQLLVRGEQDVQHSVCHDFVQHLVFHPEIEWAKQRMPPLLADLCGKVRQALDEHFARGSAGDTGA